MAAIYQHVLVVAPADIDELGHANNVAYLQWMQDAAIAHSSVQGWTAERYRSAGFVWVARTHEITYLHPARPGQRLIITTWVADMRRASSLRRYEVRVGGGDLRLATAATRWALVDLATQRPRRIPGELAASFEVLP